MKYILQTIDMWGEELFSNPMEYKEAKEQMDKFIQEGYISISILEVVESFNKF